MGLPSGSFNHVSPPRPCSHLYSSPIRATYPAHPILLYLITRIIFGEEYRSLSSSLCSLLHSPVTSPLNTFLNILFSNTLSLRFSLNVTDQVSHPYKTTGKIIVLCIVIFTFLDSKLKGRGSKFFRTLVTI